MSIIVKVFVAALFCIFAQLASSLPSGCNSSCSICDPEGILLPTDRDSIQSSIHEFERRWITCGDDRILVPLRVYIEGLEHNETSPYTVESIRNEWGNGDRTKCGRLGVFIYIRAKDGTMKVTKGKNLARQLPSNMHCKTVLNPVCPECWHEDVDVRFWSTLDNRPNRSSEWYSTGLNGTVHELADIFDEPNLSTVLFELVVDGYFILSLLFCLGYFYWLFRSQQLSERLKTIDAEDQLFHSLKNYEPISCPMCLGRFRSEDSVQKLHLGHRKKLHCGHVFGGSCWDNVKDKSTCPICSEPVDVPFVSTPALPCYNQTSCPICLENFRFSESSSLLHRLVGSDGKRIKTLPCGHVLDQSCFDICSLESCPICRGPIHQYEPPPNELDTAVYRQARSFRIRRLQALYPDLVNDATVERWDTLLDHPSGLRSLHWDWFLKNS